MARERDYKEFEIDMVICFPCNTSYNEDNLLDLFIVWVENLNGGCGGSIRELTEEDYKKLETKD